MTRSTRCILAATVLLLASPWPAHAQLVVYDPASYFQKIQQLIHEIEIIRQGTTTATQLVDMARKMGNLGQFRTPPIVRQGWNPVPILKDGRFQPIPNLVELVDAMRDGDAKRQLQNQIALALAGTGSLVYGLEQGQSIETNAAGPLTAVIKAFTSAVLSGNVDDHSVAAILQKIAAGSSIHAHQIDAGNMLQLGTLNNMGVIQQRQLNTETSQLNMSIIAIEQTESFGHSYIDGSADTLRNWRVR